MVSPVSTLLQVDPERLAAVIVCEAELEEQSPFKQIDPP